MVKRHSQPTTMHPSHHSRHRHYHLFEPSRNGMRRSPRPTSRLSTSSVFLLPQALAARHSFRRIMRSAETHNSKISISTTCFQPAQTPNNSLHSWKSERRPRRSLPNLSNDNYAPCHRTPTRSLHGVAHPDEPLHSPAQPWPSARTVWPRAAQTAPTSTRLRRGRRSVHCKACDRAAHRPRCSALRSALAISKPCLPAPLPPPG
jgi:hypothetical protein